MQRNIIQVARASSDAVSMAVSQGERRFLSTTPIQEATIVENAKQATSQAWEKTKEKAGQAADTVKETFGKASDTANETASNAYETAKSAGRSSYTEAKEKGEAVKEKAAELKEKAKDSVYEGKEKVKKVSKQRVSPYMKARLELDKEDADKWARYQ